MIKFFTVNEIKMWLYVIDQQIIFYHCCYHHYWRNVYSNPHDLTHIMHNLGVSMVQEGERSKHLYLLLDYI